MDTSVEAFLTFHKDDDALPDVMRFKDSGVKETIVRDIYWHYCASRQLFKVGVYL